MQVQTSKVDENANKTTKCGEGNRKLLHLIHRIAMNKLLPLFLGLSILFSHNSANSQSKSIDASELQVLRSIVMTDTIPTVYYKTIVSDLNQPLSRQLFYLSDFDICSSLVNLDSVKLNKRDRNYIVDRFATMEIENVNKLIRDPKNHTLKQLKGHNWFVISLPVVFRDGKYAIYYSKGAYSGQFVLMKNVEGSWKNVCYSSVWSE
jgi:hypothetical protein